MIAGMTTRFQYPASDGRKVARIAIIGGVKKPGCGCKENLTV
jgi:hypothetical protein